VKQAGLIMQIIAKIINEIYSSIGLAGERTKEDNSQGIDNSSGVAKAYDFERVNSLLHTKADSLEQVERKLCELVSLYNSSPMDTAPDATVADNTNQMVEYPDDFDVRGLYDEFDIAARLALISAPDGVRRNQMQSVIDKLFPMIAQDILAKMKSELAAWPPVDPLTAPGGAPSPMSPASLQSQGSKSVATTMLKQA
jgi:hypothetical protein